VRGGIQEASRSEGARPTARRGGRPAADRGVAPRRCSAEHRQTKHLVLRARPLRGAARSRRSLQRCRQLVQRHSQLLHCELPLPALLGKLLLQLPHAGDRHNFASQSPPAISVGPHRGWPSAAGPPATAPPRVRQLPAAASASGPSWTVCPRAVDDPRRRRRSERKTAMDRRKGRKE